MRATLLRGGESSRGAQAAVDAGWAPLQAVEGPQELYTAMQQQQAACDGVLRCKDHVVTAMREALSGMESEYVRTLQAHAGVSVALAQASRAAQTRLQLVDAHLCCMHCTVCMF